MGKMAVEYKEYTLTRTEKDITIYKDGRGQDTGYLVHVATIPCDIFEKILKEDKG